MMSGEDKKDLASSKAHSKSKEIKNLIKSQIVVKYNAVL